MVEKNNFDCFIDDNGKLKQTNCFNDFCALLLSNKNGALDSYVSDSGMQVVLYSERFYPEPENDYNFVNLQIHAFALVNKYLQRVGYCGGNCFTNSGIVSLDAIGVVGREFTNNGIGKGMLKLFEESAFNHNGNIISGIFCPFKDSVAKYDEVKEFYLKNGYSIKKSPDDLNRLSKKLTNENMIK